MFARHNIYANEDHVRESLRAQFPEPCTRREQLWFKLRRRLISRFLVGADAFGRESDGASVAEQYRQLGLQMRPANMDRVGGWSAISQRLGDVDAGILPTLFIHRRCGRLLECLPSLQHDPDRPGDVLKSNISDEGVGGDDAADALRYLVATRPRLVFTANLRGF